MSTSYAIGDRCFEADGKYLALELPDSSPLLGDPAALRQRLSDDGFLFIRGFHDPDAVLAARRDMLHRLAERGMLDPNQPESDGVVAADKRAGATSSVRGNDYLKTPSVRDVLYGPRTMKFFDELFGQAATHFNFEWLRAAPPGAGSPIHCDMVYMGRGSQRLLTLWTPFGHITPEMGPLAVCLNSHRWDDVIATYGRDDVDRNRTRGVFSDDPAELVDRFGGRWATTTFEPGDAVVLCMYNLHASLKNQSDRFRISCDTRYQPASEPLDDRWGGDPPRGHEVLWSDGVELESVAQSRVRWGI
ncbi:1-deoxypentalenic acid 11-beta-hydroxylase [Pirellulimonas nuda]|uniref:1-deoxypentalenic acid 11-beta-hydroxylase n=1 Tax=Pirellulimonas nuda TaxID=2528009 RepID=A0A518DHI8_9BACT|nr:phytanoyl-CoA dioxygenase family protein [Pirellulimonas nuda]QDU90939.1 1-deoxypentalenic acid 11-beta-hydroxylase [Pirellulimonas nuda]